MICAKIVVFAQESKNLIIISESIPNLLPPPAPLPHTDCTDLTGFLCGWEISQMLSATIKGTVLLMVLTLIACAIAKYYLL